MLAVPVVLLVAVPASATTLQHVPLAQVQADTVAFGLLGPVGVVAIVIGLVGMVAGTVRHRRRLRSAAEPETASEHDAIQQQPTSPMRAPVDSRR